MRWMLSRTDASGSPTRRVLGIWAYELSTSTSTGTASIPTRAKVFNLASTSGRSEDLSPEPPPRSGEGGPDRISPPPRFEGVAGEAVRDSIVLDLLFLRLVALDQPLDRKPDQR